MLVLDVKLFHFKDTLKLWSWQLNGALAILLNVDILSKYAVMSSCVRKAVEIAHIRRIKGGKSYLCSFKLLLGLSVYFLYHIVQANHICSVTAIERTTSTLTVHHV